MSYVENLKDIEKLLTEKITVDSLNRINDLFLRYLFSHPGNENIVLNFVNAVFKDSNFETFSKIEILNPYNIAENINEKESIVDIKAYTDSGIIVLIEIQSRGNEDFIKRALFYWAYNYSSNLNRGSEYDELKATVSINITNFILNNVDNRVHTCYMLKELHNNRILTDHCQLHFVELPKFNLQDVDKLDNELISWIKFLKGENMSRLIKENTIFEEVEKRCITFLNTNPVMDEYKKKELDSYFLNRSIKLDLKKAEEKGMTEGIKKGIKEGRKEGIKEGKKEGIKEGKKEGIKENQIVIAKNMKLKNMDIDLISELTGLSIEEINKL